MLEVYRLYPQYRIVSDRRRESVPVENDRRSGSERRSQSRITLDTELKRDIFEVKNKVSQIQKTSPKNVESLNFRQNSSLATQETSAKDQFIKTINETNNTPAIQAQVSNGNKDLMLAGVILSVMAGVLSAAFLGPVAAGVGVGIGVYLGAKLLKQTVSTHLKEKDKD